MKEQLSERPSATQVRLLHCHCNERGKEAKGPRRPLEEVVWLPFRVVVVVVVVMIVLDLPTFGSLI